MQYEIPNFYREETPKELVQHITNLSMIPTTEFQNNIKEITKLHGCPFIVRSSTYRKGNYVFHFVCPFHRSEEPCKAFFIFKGDINNIKFSNGFWEHNHKIDATVYGQLRLLSNETKKEIINLRKVGLTPGMTRRRLNLTINTSQFYNICRKVLAEERNKVSLEDTLNKLSARWVIHCHYNEEKLEALVMIAKWLIGSAMSKDIWITDDTSCTNFEQMYIVPILVVDEFGSPLMLGLSCISDRTEESFKIIYSDTLKYIHNVRIGIMDRHKGQSNAFQEIIGAKIVFCQRHIRENIKRNSLWLLPTFDNFVHSKISEKEFIETINSKLEKEPENHHLKLLKEDLDNYSPERLKDLRLLGIRSTNYIEGAFGNVKDMNEHNILRLPNVIESFDIWAEMQKENHYKKVRKNKNNTIEKCELNNIGTIAQENLKEVLNQLKNVCMLFVANDMEKVNKMINNCDHYHFTEYGLPCLCKLFHKQKANRDNILIHRNDIPRRLLIYDSTKESHLDDIPGGIIKNKVTNTQLSNRSFTSTMSLFEQVATRIVGNDERVIKLTEHFLNDIQQLPTPGGARVTVPALNTNISHFKKNKKNVGRKEKKIKSMSDIKTSKENNNLTITINNSQRGNMLLNEGLSLLRKHRPKEAVPMFKRSFELFQSCGNPNIQILSYYLLANMWAHYSCDFCMNLDIQKFCSHPLFAPLYNLADAYEKRDIVMFIDRLESVKKIYSDNMFNGILEEIRKFVLGCAIIDFCSPFSELEIRYLAKSLHCEIDECKKVCIDLIISNKIRALIDEENGIIKMIPEVKESLYLKNIREMLKTLEIYVHQSKVKIKIK